LLRFLAILLTFAAGELRYAELDSWPGRIFTSRSDSAKVGYKTLLEKQSLTRQDQGFQEILELALSSEQRVSDTIAKEHIGSIETITMGPHSPLGKSQGFSTADEPFRAPLPRRACRSTWERRQSALRVSRKGSQGAILYAHSPLVGSDSFSGWYCYKLAFVASRLPR
jgi:hypothetical protein